MFLLFRQLFFFLVKSVFQFHTIAFCPRVVYAPGWWVVPGDSRRTYKDKLPWTTTIGVVYGPLFIPRWAVGTVLAYPHLDMYLVNEQAPANTAGVARFLIDRFTYK